MWLIKEFVVPLIPFSLEAFIKVTFLDLDHWWNYIDSGTVVLTFSFWALFLVTRSNLEPPIPTDSSVVDDLKKLHNTFSTIVVFGFSLFGIVSVCKVLSDRFPQEKDFIYETVLFNTTIISIVFCVLVLVLILLNRRHIARVSG